MTGTLPPSPRLTLHEVCTLAGYSRTTLEKRIKAGKMPAPVDRGRVRLFDRRAVYKALGMITEESQHGATIESENQDPWGAAAHALAQHHAATLHGR